MDFEKLKNKAINFWKEAIDNSAKKLSESKFTIKNKKELEELIAKSQEKRFTNKETWETKKFKKKSIVIVWEEESTFFKKALINFPVLLTKAFSQSIEIKMAKSNTKDIDFSEYTNEAFPCMIVFMDEKVYKVISGEESILKLVKSMNLDINKEIENI